MVAGGKHNRPPFTAPDPKLDLMLRELYARTSGSGGSGGGGQGPRGPQGAQGPAGPAGADGAQLSPLAVGAGTLGLSYVSDGSPELSTVIPNTPIITVGGDGSISSEPARNIYTVAPQPGSPSATLSRLANNHNAATCILVGGDTDRLVTVDDDSVLDADVLDTFIVTGGDLVLRAGTVIAFSYYLAGQRWIETARIDPYALPDLETETRYARIDHGHAGMAVAPIPLADLELITSQRLLGRVDAGTGVVQQLQVGTTSTISPTWTDAGDFIDFRVRDDSILNQHLNNMVQSRIKGRASGTGTDNPVDLTPDQVIAILNEATTQLDLGSGGTQADLTATGPGFLKQASLGAAVTVGTLAAGDIPAHASTHETGGSDPITSLAATVLTSGLVPLARLQEVMALADLSDVTGTTGGSSVVVKQTNPTIGGFVLTGQVNLGNGVASRQFNFDSTNLSLDFVRTPSAVNYFELTHAATGNRPAFDATGTDADVAPEFGIKGTTLQATIAGGKAPGEILTTGSLAADLPDHGSTHAAAGGDPLQVSATDRLLGRVSASAGAVEEIEITDFVQSILNDPDAATVRATLGLGALATGSSAADIAYTPAVLTDWDGDADPGDVDNALDQLAERVDDLEGAGGGGYTDEQAQDAVGPIMTDSAEIDFDYNDTTPSITAVLINNSVVAARLKATATDILFGRSTAGAGAGEEIACTAFGRSLIDDADAAAGRATLGLGTIATVNSPVPIANGGTGQTSQTAAFDALSPLTTIGDLITFDGSDNIRLATGGGGAALRSNGAGTALKWISDSFAPTTSGIQSSFDYAGGTMSWYLAIDALTADASPDSAADYVVTYDASAGTNKKVLLSNLPGGGSLSSHNHTSAGGDGGVLTNDEHDGFLDILEIATPANPATDHGRLFCRANGSNIELVFLSSQGAECVICSLPDNVVNAELQLNLVE